MKRIWSCLVVVGGFLLTSGISQGQTVTVTGQVLSRSKKPISGAQIRADSMVGAIFTDSLGRFRLQMVIPGRLTVRAIGYSPLDSVLSGGILENISLTLRETQILPTVQVRSNLSKPDRYGSTTRFDQFYERRARDRGRFFTREDIERGNKTQVVDLLTEVPGVRVNKPRPGIPLNVRFSRCSGTRLTAPFASGSPQADLSAGLIAVYVDGRQLASKDAVDFLDGLPTSAVEAVEVYSGPSQLPVEAVGDACAAIFVWTRFVPRAHGDTLQF